MADRFYCPEGPIAGQFVLSGDEAHHAIRVRRVDVGELLEVFDGKGRGFLATVTSVGGKQVELVVLEEIEDRSLPVPITLATAVPKGERFDWLIEKATELGVARVVPLLTQRSTVDPRASKLDRLRRSIVEASKQCARFRLMELDGPRSFSAYLQQERAGVRLIAHPGGRGPTTACSGPRTASSIAMLVGPEGGFTNDEIEAARAQGWVVVSLGPTLLRIETAAIALTSALLASFWDEKHQ